MDYSRVWKQWWHGPDRSGIEPLAGVWRTWLGAMRQERMGAYGRISHKKSKKVRVVKGLILFWFFVKHFIAKYCFTFGAFLGLIVSLLRILFVICCFWCLMGKMRFL
ncbi:hypothetical protein B0682_08170 [Moraxella lincolnii]|uniref:Transmembrane protein n=1 Tax=Lwoffella lincolnii TaxID=90241 RepID=A0A1T0CC52_9GAMM|nr:hypothetical protein B0682_08170 [Moraxella lincolnii]